MPTQFQTPNPNYGCFVLFGVPFAGIGLFFAAVSYKNMNNPNFKNPGIGILMGLLFALIGIGIMAAGYFAAKKNRAYRATQAAYPDQPWMWQSDWAQGRAVGQTGGSTAKAWFFAVVWNGISWGCVWGALLHPDHKAPWFAILLITIFPLIGIWLLIWAGMQTLRVVRYGETAMQLQTLPAPLGRSLKGTVEARLPYPLPHGINLALTCVNRVTTQSGKDRTTTDYTMWQDRKNLGSEQIMAGPIGSTIPIDIGVPRNQPPTNHANQNNLILWLLRIEADVPGVNFDELYEVPVFETRESPSLQDWKEKEVEQERAHPATAPLRPIVQVSSAPQGGTQFYFPASSNRGSALGVTIFAVIFGGAEYAILNFHAPLFFAIIFGFFTLLLLLITLKLWFGTAIIVANSNGIELHTNTLGLSGQKRWSAADVSDVYPKITMQTGGARGTAHYSVTVRDRMGREYSIANSIPDHNESQWICDQLRQLASVKTQSAAG